MANEKHLYVTFGGGYTSSATALVSETWQFGVRFILNWGSIDPVASLPNNWNPVPDQHGSSETAWDLDSNWSVDGPLTESWDPLQWLNDNVGAAADNYVGATNSASQIVELRQIRCYPIGPDGKAIAPPPYAQGSPATLTYTGTLPTGGMTGSLPPQTTPVISLLTAQTGRRGRGRYYHPLGGSAVMANGVMSSTGQTNLLAAAKQFLEDCSVSNAAPGTVNIRPIVVGAPWVNYGRVDNIRLGRAYDTQRRRRRAAEESYSSAALDIG